MSTGDDLTPLRCGVHGALTSVLIAAVLRKKELKVLLLFGGTPCTVGLKIELGM